VCADEEMVRYLINASRPFIYSTAPSPPAAAAALAALALLQERPQRVQRLHANARALRRALAAEGFAVPEQDMPIVPLVLGEERAAVRFCQAAIERGVFAQAIRPPTVPAGTSRLRLAAMASHTPADMARAARALAAAARQVSLDPAEIGPPLAPAPPDEAWAAEVEAEPPEVREASVAPPFDIEQSAGLASAAPFDHERDSEIARAA
jgi:glycine C-acetyltransferase/8-amino-7-oxononanoate synthase